MSDSLDSLAIMTLQSNVEYTSMDRYEAWNLIHFGDEGLKRSKAYDGRYEPDGITDLTAKQKLRRDKVCEWLDKYFRRNPAERKPQSRPGQLRSLLGEVPDSLVLNISNFPGYKHHHLGMIHSLAIATAVDFDENEKFLLILVILSLVYGGIHLATWNFAFPSKTEHLLWKIACIDIMATVPTIVLCIRGLFYLRYYLASLSRSFRRSNPDLHKYLVCIVLDALSVSYALSRIYIVVESFISLRRVPIGVYAALPWVQAIPHV